MITIIRNATAKKMNKMKEKRMEQAREMWKRKCDGIINSDEQSVSELKQFAYRFALQLL